LLRVYAVEATPDFTQEYKLDDPSCGDAVRPEGEAAAAEAITTVSNVWGIIGTVGRFRFLNEM